MSSRASENRSCLSSVFSAVLFSVFLLSTSYCQSFDDDEMSEEGSQILHNGDTLRVHQSFPTFLFKIEYDTIISLFNGNEDEQCETAIKIYGKNRSKPIQILKDTNYFQMLPNIVDINFDGYKDICLYKSITGGSPQYAFYTFTPSKMEFEYNSEFDRLSDYKIDEDSKKIESYIYYLGRGGRTETFRITNGHLVLIGLDEVDCDLHEKQEMIDGVLQITSKSYAEDSYSETRPTKRILSEYDWILDTLRIKTKIWETDIGLSKWTEKQHINDIIRCSPCACYIVDRKEIYSYKRMSKGEIEQTIRQYKVVNDEWILASTEKHIK